jgi:hypothetical protein
MNNNKRYRRQLTAHLTAKETQPEVQSNVATDVVPQEPAPERVEVPQSTMQHIRSVVTNFLKKD